MNIHTDVLRAESHREIGLLLQRNAARIVERWCDMARNEQTSAQRVHHTVLRDELPMLLHAIGRALEETDDSGAAANRRVAREHGAQRWENGWSLADVVRDYQLLRLAVLEFLEQDLARPLYNREAMAVSVYIDDAIAASIARYVAHRDASAASVEHERAQALEDLSRRKDEFLAILGHELRNPLAPIRNSVTVIRRLLGTANPAVATSLDVLDRQSAQLGRLVDDLLDLARISRGEFELRKEKIDARVAVDQAVQMAESLIKERGHHVRIATPARAVSMEADPHRLCQIAANLLTNAAKYTDPGGTIQITLEEDGEWVVLRVSDDGIGIAPDVLSHVFELFARAGQNEANERDGLGIGLALVQRLVHQHGGTISAASDGPGKGAEFVVRLPKHGATVTPADPLLLIQPVPFERP